MAKYDELPVYKVSYDLLLEIFRFTKEFNREFKYTVGESLRKETLELITGYPTHSRGLPLSGKLVRAAPEAGKPKATGGLL
jgi:hypothetical protein